MTGTVTTTVNTDEMVDLMLYIDRVTEGYRLNPGERNRLADIRESIIAGTPVAQRTKRGGERGSVPILDIVAAVFVALVVAFCFNMTHRSEPLQLTTVQPTTTASTVTLPQAAPGPAQAAPGPQASAPAPAQTPDVATATVGGNETASGEILPNPTVQLACEIIDNGPDAIASGRPADWYPITTDDATVAAAPDRFRNCTTIAAP